MYLDSLHLANWQHHELNAAVGAPGVPLAGRPVAKSPGRHPDPPARRLGDRPSRETMPPEPPQGKPEGGLAASTDRWADPSGDAADVAEQTFRTVTPDSDRLPPVAPRRPGDKSLSLVPPVLRC